VNLYTCRLEIAFKSSGCDARNLLNLFLKNARARNQPFAATNRRFSSGSYRCDRGLAPRRLIAFAPVGYTFRR
jgi:hypothetical protein